MRVAFDRQHWLIDDMVARLRAMPADRRARERAHAEIALTNPRNAAETLRSWAGLHELAKEPNGARITAALREALLTSIASKLRTWMGVYTALTKLLTLPEDQVPAAVDALLSAPAARLDNAHGIYLAAARVAKADVLPRSPPHGNGPMPQITARGYVEVALMLAEHALPHVPAKDQRVATQMLALARTALAGPSLSLLPSLTSLTEAAPKGAAMRVVRAVLLETRHMVASPDKVGGAVRAAAKTTMALVGTAELLSDLDESLCAADCAAALVRHGKSTTSPVARAIWRGADAKGKGNVWLFRLKDERWALLVKLKNRWTVTEGSADDVLATVPADRFEEAVKAAQPFR